MKNFDNTLLRFNVGDKVPMKRCGYPPSGLFFCAMNPSIGVVVIEKGIFKGIKDKNMEKIALKFPKMRIWDCQENEYKRKAKA